MKTILIIDDSESHRILLKEELLNEGFKVITANNNEKVLSGYREFSPDFIILELRQKNSEDGSFHELRKLYPNIPWIGYSTFIHCPNEFKELIDFYLPKSSRKGLRRKD